MAIAVVILTGIDGWLQPATKWKAHYRYNDNYISAETELLGIPPQDTTSLHELRKQVDQIDANYRKEVLT